MPQQKSSDPIPAGPKLVIVESPAKARTIGKYLGGEFRVQASMGHIIDLPESALGVDPDNDFEPVYKPIKGKGKIVKVLRAAAKEATAVYLAPDPDREGEAIAWHIANAIGERDGVYRVLFNEITARGVRDAMREPGRIDMNLVDAYQARRVLDRVVGYKVSPFLWRTVTRGLSAGRVQSVALRLVCAREDEIEAFEPQEYWSVDARFARASGEIYEAQLERIEGKKPKQISAAEAADYAQRARAAEFAVREVQRKEKRRQPYPPFMTSTLQQEASRRFGFTAKRTMRLAQQLYEGMELPGEEAAGLITYMRTDSLRISQDALDESRAWLTEHEPELVPEKARVFRSRKGAQDAHEAIRPTSVTRHPERLKGVLNRDLWRLYDLIWRRFVASQCRVALYDTTTVTVAGGGLDFKAVGSVLRVPGFTKVYPLAGRKKAERSESDDAEKEKEVLLPAIEEGEPARLDELKPVQHFTKPPPRYTEASLVKEMEARGIGRPSTYAATLATLTDRKYVEKEQKRLVPTDLGRDVTRILTAAFSRVFEVGFTADMEGQLDQVESGTKEWKRLVREFWAPFSDELAAAMGKRKEWKALIEEKVGDPCPECGRALVKKWGRHGRFLACEGFPECNHSRPLEVPDEAAPSEQPCSACGAEMVLREGRFGRFWSCSAYPKCKETRPYLIGVGCPKEGCKGQVTEKKSRRGRLFFGCNGYPECKFTSWDRPVDRACGECDSTYLVEKKDALVCPSCKRRVAALEVHSEEPA